MMTKHVAAYLVAAMLGLSLQAQGLGGGSDAGPSEAARTDVVAVANAVEPARVAPDRVRDATYRTFADALAQRRAERVGTLAPVLVPSPSRHSIYNPIDLFVTSMWPVGSDPLLCDDYAFIRRVYLDLLGHVPTVEEVENFVFYEADNKRTLLIDALLARNDEYAEHWVQFWEDALCSNGRHQGGVGTRGNFREFIRESFLVNKPYDAFVAQLLDPGSAYHAAGFVKTALPQESLDTAAKVGQVFMGTAMKCATCHDDFLNSEWTQNRFYGFASYFSEDDLEIVRCEEKKGVFVQPAFLFENATPSDQPELSTLNDRLSAVAAAIIDPANPRFASTFVNRLWKRYMGLGLIEPVDETREDRPPSHPEMLQWLTHEFVSNSYDIKHVIRLILNSRTYQLKFDPRLADRYVQGEDRPRLFRSPSHRRLTCEQILDSISVALQTEQPRTYTQDTSTGLTSALGRPATRNEVSTQRPSDVAIIQALEFINGPALHEIVSQAPLVVELAESSDRGEAVESAFLGVLSRPAGEAEKELTLAYLGETPSSEEWTDVLWGLVVGPEFQYVR